MFNFIDVNVNEIDVEPVNGSLVDLVDNFFDFV